MKKNNQFKIDTFPDDGNLWMIRWVDKYRFCTPHTATPSVDVLLSRLATKTDRARVHSAPELTTATVQVGLVPSLVIGDIYQSGRLVGSIPQDSIRLQVDLRSQSTTITTAATPLDDPPPDWKSRAPYRLLNSKEYRTGREWMGSYCLTFQDLGHSALIIIPCYEVFRALMCPTSDFARALTSGPWSEHGPHDIVNPDETFKRDDHTWQIKVRPAIKKEHHRIAANLWIGKYGRSAAESIYVNAIRDSEPWRLRVPLPFGEANLRFVVSGLWMRTTAPRKFLATEILDLASPYPHIKMWFDRDNNATRSNNPSDLDKPEPYENRRSGQSGKWGRTAQDQDAEDVVDSSTDPSSRLTPSVNVQSRLRIHGDPPCEEVPKEVSYRYRKRAEGSATSSDNGRLSAGRAYQGTSRTRPLQNESQVPKRAALFDRFIEMLTALQEDGVISRLSVEVPPVDWHAPRNIHAWAMPRNPADWRQIRSETLLSKGWEFYTEDVPRAALVVSFLYLETDRPCSVCAIEIERRPSEAGFKCLLFVAPKTGSLTAVTPDILRMATSEKGRWDAVRDEIQDLTGTTTRTWKHYRDRSNTNSDTGPTASEGALNRHSFQRALRDLVALETDNARIIEPG